MGVRPAVGSMITLKRLLVQHANANGPVAVDALANTLLERTVVQWARTLDTASSLKVYLVLEAYAVSATNQVATADGCELSQPSKPPRAFRQVLY